MEIEILIKKPSFYWLLFTEGMLWVLTIYFFWEDEPAAAMITLLLAEVRGLSYVYMMNHKQL